MEPSCLRSLSLCCALTLACPLVAEAQASAPELAQERRTVLAEQATREPFTAPNGLPVTPIPPRQTKEVTPPPPPQRPASGAALETRAPVNPAQKPAFREQTRAPAHHSSTPLEIRIFARGLSKPWGLAFLPDGRLLVSEKSGTMRIVSREGKPGKALKGVPPVLYQGDAGLLDVVLDPAFSQNRRFYFSFVGFRPDGNTLMVVRARLSDDDSRLEELTQLLTLPPFHNSAHYGGRLLLATDATLYIGSGERIVDATRLAAQDCKSPLGKVLRIDLDGNIPADNPYAQVTGADPTVFSIGHRDVQGLALQPGTHALWVTDHGPQGGDELDIVKPGHNYGWPVVAYGLEYSGALINGGRSAWPGTDQPVYYWDPAIAPSGATFYSGSAIPEWKSDLFVAALAGQHLVHLVIRGDMVVGEERLLEDQKQRVRDVRQGPDGALWVLTDDEKDGRIIRIAAKPSAKKRAGP
ncbi:MAG: glucose sorbosone dehydrogenase [Myxococcaceae bacterium]|nr:glucose sorbosone dehydrogenase [Myxococcaceae bacterium]